MYFQTTMLMNIGTDYSALVSAIQKDWNDDTTNLAEAVLQIIRYLNSWRKTRRRKTSPRTQRLLHKPRVRRKRVDGPLHRLLLDKESRTTS